MVSYSDLQAANPYRNQSYKKSGWQNLLSALGFRTEADAWQENMNVQAAEYDAALLQKQRDTEYEDPSAQVDRMRSAGFNPDLDPSTISSGESAPMGDDPSNPMQSVGEEGVVLGFANNVLSAFTTCVGLTSGVQGVISNHLKNRLLKFEVDKGDTESGLSLANELFPLTLPQSPETQLLDNGSEESWLVGAINRAKLLTKHMNSRTRERVLANLSAYWNSAPKSADAWKEWARNVSSEKEYYGESSQFFSDDSRVMRSIYEHLGRAREQVEKLKITAEGQGLSAEIAEDENRERMAEGLDVPTAVRAENATNEAKYDDAKIKAILRGTIKDILSDLDKNQSTFAEIFKTFLSVLSFQYM